MDQALKLTLARPNLLKDDPEILEKICNLPGYKAIKSLLETGNTCDLAEQAPPGVTINFGKIDVNKNYASQNEYGHLLHDVMIPGNAPISQILHNHGDSRVLIPYAYIAKSSDERTNHINRIKEAIVAVCEQIGQPIQIGNIIVNDDPRGYAVLQIANKHVNSLSDNKKFTELVANHIDEKYKDDTLSVAIRGGYGVFRYNDHYQKYPLFAETPENNYGVLQKLIHDPAAPVININITQYNTNINSHNNSNNTVIGNNSSVCTGNTKLVVKKSNVTNVTTTALNFSNYLKTNKPTWYLEDRWVPKTFLREKYNEVMKDSEDRRKFNFILSAMGLKCEMKRLNGKPTRSVYLKSYESLK